MLMMIEPIVEALRSVKQDNSYVALVGPRGKTLNQQLVRSMTSIEHLILICGHYEGVDSRIKHYIDAEISIGDYILTGGETASMIIADSIIRLLPGVIKEESHLDESFENNGFWLGNETHIHFDISPKAINEIWHAGWLTPAFAVSLIWVSKCV